MFARIRFTRLLSGYRSAFQEWSRQVQSLQAIRSTSGSTALRQARARAGEAHVVYRESRDLLADFMLARLSDAGAPRGRRTSIVLAEIKSLPARDRKSGSTDHRSRVARMAYHLWEAAGRPPGSADADWFRAEQMIAENL